MAEQIINTGTAPNNGTGDPLRTAFIKTDNNFDQIWAAGPVGSNVRIQGNTVSTLQVNQDLALSPNGTGNVRLNNNTIPGANNTWYLGSVTNRWRGLYAGNVDATNISVSNGLTVNGDVGISGNLTVEGDTIQIGNIVTDTKTIQLSNTAANGAQANGSGITVGANDNIATFLYNSTSNSWVTNLAVTYANGQPIGKLPGGSNTYIQFNDSGNFGGNANFTYNRATGNLGLGGANISGVAGNNQPYVVSMPGIAFQGSSGVMEYDAFNGHIDISQSLSIDGTLELLPNSITNGAMIKTPGGSGIDISIEPSGNLYLSADGGEVIVSDQTPSTTFNDGALIVLGGVGVDGNINLSGNITAANIIPRANAVYSLGNATNQWSDLYVSNATIYMNNVPISLGAGNVLTVNGEAVLSNDSNTSISTTGNITAEQFIGNIITIGLSGLGRGDDDYIVYEGQVPSGIRPSNPDMYNLGNVGYAWQEVHANVFYGNGSQLTGLSFTSISNDGSIVDIVVPNGDVTITADSTQTWAFDTTGNLILPNNGSIVVDGGDGVIGPVSDDLVIAWDNEEIRLVSVQGSIEMQADAAFRVQTNYDGGTDTYLSRWEFNQDEIVNITGPSAIVTEAGNLNLQGGRDTLSSGNVTVTAINNGVSVNTWTFDNTGNLIAPGNITTTGNVTGDVGFFNDVIVNNAGTNALLYTNSNREIYDTAFAYDSGNDIISGSGAISTTGNISAGYFIGDGSLLTGLPASYSDSNVATFLAAFGSNTISTTGNITAGNIATDWLNIGNIGNTATLEANVSLQIVADASGSAPYWTFNSDGNLYVPGNINGDNNAPLVIDGASAGVGYISLPHSTFGAEQIAIVNKFPLGNGVRLETNGGNLFFDNNADLSVTGNVTASYFIGDGSQLTGLPASYSNANVATFLAAFGSNTISTTGNITAGNITGNINITGNVTGTSANVSLVAGSYTWTFDNTGSVTLPAVGGNEGAEIQLTQSANSTLSGNTVSIDQYVDQVRIFEGGGTTRGVYIDLTQAAPGVGTLLNNRVSGLVNAGSFVTMDNIKATVVTGVSNGLGLATVSGTMSGYIAGQYVLITGSPGGSAASVSLTTSTSTSILNYNFPGEGDTSYYTLRDNTNGRVYRITLMIGASYNNNFISIERLL